MRTKNFLSCFAIFCISVFIFHSCDIEDLIPEDTRQDDTDEEFATGVDHQQEEEGMDFIPRDLSLVVLSDATAGTLSSVSLEPWVPPVLSQGQYGTCTAWACGYFARTIMYARENDLSQEDLRDESNVFSPLDLFLSIESRGDNCYGSWSGAAFEVMQKRGIATMATAPYENLGKCDWSPKPSWNSEAGNYKIDKYRIVDYTNIESVKSYIQLGRPVQVSCVLGLNFKDINDGSVLYNDDYSLPPEKHGRHAMVVVGYDDDKGANGAFRIVNSWGERWGDDGYFWVDYNFFADQLVYSAYIIDGDSGGLAQGIVDESVINPNYRVDGKDLLAVQLVDEYDDYPGNPPNARALTYNVFNRGKEDIPSSDNWNIVYYYYNAYNPENDFGIVIYDSYTDEVGSRGEHGDFEDIPGETPHQYGKFNWWNNVDIPSGYSVASAVYGDDGYDHDFVFYYQIPEDLTGEYYFVLYADGFNVIEEQYEQNNFMFFTGEEREPLTISNGVIQEPIAKSGAIRRGANPRDLKSSQPNAYDIDEIASLVKHQKETGILERKMIEYKNARKTTDLSKGRGYTGKKVIKARLPR